MSAHALLGVPGKLKSIYTDTQLMLSRWSATLAGRLDTNVSSRAAAATALSTAVWTAAKAAFIDAAITTRPRIKAIQRGTISLPNAGSLTGTATITAVGTGRTELRLLGVSSDNSDARSNSARISLTNSTTITATRGYTGGNTVVSWELTEYYSEGT